LDLGERSEAQAKISLPRRLGPNGYMRRRWCMQDNAMAVPCAYDDDDGGGGGDDDDDDDDGDDDDDDADDGVYDGLDNDSG